MPFLKINIETIVSDENLTGSLFDIYNSNKYSNLFSVQSKPRYDKSQFVKIAQNSGINKVIIYYGNELLGFSLITENLDSYPGSHYSKEFFLKNSHFLSKVGAKKIVFFIGDRGGFFFSKKFASELKKNRNFFTDIILLLFETIKSIIGSPIIYIWDQSEHASRMLLLKDTKIDYLNEIRKVADVGLIDKETFVQIHWMDNIISRSRLFWSLKLVGKIIHNNFENNENNGERLLFESRNLFGNKYFISHFSKMDKELCDQFYSVYHQRLMGVNIRSPQKLEYNEETFRSYLSDPKIDKYILNNNKEIVGGCLLISKYNSSSADWVSPEWRYSDAYVKLIFVNRGEAKFAYLFLFAVSIQDLLLRLGTISNARILADWSEEINGKKFRQSLNIIQVPFLPDLIQDPKIIRPQTIFAKILIKLANFKATQLDSDSYYYIESRR